MTGPDVVALRSGGPAAEMRHGRWSLQVRGDEVADIRFDGRLLLRAIRPVVRDADWNTVPVRVLAAEEDTAGGSGPRPALRRSLRFENDGIDYAGELTVRLEESALVVDFAGEARSAFSRNRVGLVVLHPATCAGSAVEVEHTDASLEKGRWPVPISPHQPFVDVRGFRWTTGGTTAHLTLEGDVYETEDQRNWTDASFKTYSTPLSLPFPVPLAVGDRITHRVRLDVVGAHAGPVSATEPEVLRIGAAAVGTLPPVSVGAAVHPAPDEPLRLTGIEAVLVELTGRDDCWPDLLAEAARQAEALSAGLDVRLVTDDPEVVRTTVRSLLRYPVLRLGAFDPDGHVSTAPLWAALGDEARHQGLSATLLGGTRAHFAELNRRQADLPADAPALTLSLTPQMHATEVPHLIDSLATQRTVAENAVRIAAGRPVHVGPVTLARRFNAVATGARPDPATEAARATDPLLDTDLAAAWTLASVAALAVPGVAGLAYFETVGPRGLVDDQGRPRPVASVVSRLAGLRGRSLKQVAVPPGFAAVAVDDGDGTVLLVANLTGEARDVPVQAIDGTLTRVPLAPWGTTELRLGS